MTQPISGPANIAPQAVAKDSDGDNDGSKGAAAAPAKSSIGPAVILNLSNVAKPDMALGDPDHDGK